MKTGTMRLDRVLLADVDQEAAPLGLTRAAFTQKALHAAIRSLQIQEARRHREGYRGKPVGRAISACGKTNKSGRTDTAER